MRSTVAAIVSALSLVSCLAVRDGAGNGVSKSTYASTYPVTGKTFLLKYLNVATADDECTSDLCTCSDDDETWYIQQGRVAISSWSSTLEDIQVGVSPGFGLHLVNLTHRLTTGGNSVQEVESYFATKFSTMVSTGVYDSFADYSIGLYTDDVDTLISAFDSDSVSYTTLEWTSDGSTWYSVMVLVPTTHMVLEIYASSSSLLASRSHIKSEPRLSSTVASSMIARFAGRGGMNVSTTYSTTNVYATRVNRAASDLDAVASFYEDVMGASLATEYDADGVTRDCYLYSSATVDICFTKRDDDATVGDFSVADMESQMNSVHSNLLAKPTCGTDKWLDNHHAYDSMSESTSTIVSYLQSSAGSDTYYYCEPSGNSYSLHYIIDPTGWGIQLDLQSSSSGSLCSTSAELELGGSFNPACDLGYC